MTGAADPGPFGPVVGYVGAIAAATAAIGVTWRGKLKDWKPPEEDLPNTAQKVVLLLACIGMVTVWFYIEPANADRFLIISIGAGLVALFGFIFYLQALKNHSYHKVVAIDAAKTATVKILGGDELLKEAEKAMRGKNLTVQDYLEGVAYDPDRVWTRASRAKVTTIVVSLFILVLLTGTLAMSTLGFVVQVKLTGKPAAAVINREHAPGLEPDRR